MYVPCTRLWRCISWLHIHHKQHVHHIHSFGLLMDPYTPLQHLHHVHGFGILMAPYTPYTACTPYTRLWRSHGSIYTISSMYILKAPYTPYTACKTIYTALAFTWFHIYHVHHLQHVHGFGVLKAPYKQYTPYTVCTPYTRLWHSQPVSLKAPVFYFPRGQTKPYN